MAMTQADPPQEPTNAERPGAAGEPAVKADAAPPAAERGNDANESERGLGVLQLVSSALAAGLGVQSSKNRERDFKQGRAGAFILAGLIFTALFIGGVYGVVSLVLSSR